MGLKKQHWNSYEEKIFRKNLTLKQKLDEMDMKQNESVLDGFYEKRKSTDALPVFKTIEVDNTTMITLITQFWQNDLEKKLIIPLCSTKN